MNNLQNPTAMREYVMSLGYRRPSNFNPLTVSGLVAWWDASHAAGLFQNSNGTTAAASDGDPVGYMVDRSGNTKHLTQNSSNVEKPTLKIGVQNNRNAIRFDAVNDTMTSVLGSVPVTIIMACKSTASGSDLGLYRYASNATVQGVTHHLSSLFYSYYGASSRNISKSHGTTATIITRIWRGGSTQADMDLYINGVAGTSKNSTPNNTDAGSQIILGNSAFESGYAGIDLYEMFIFSTALSGSDILNIENYLRPKWGL